MADNCTEANIKELIKMRKQRPAFSRMISWEFSQLANQRPVRSRQRKKKLVVPEVRVTHSSDNIENEVSEHFDSSTNSEYETAHEDVEDTVVCDETLVTEATSISIANVQSETYSESLDSDNNEDKVFSKDLHAHNSLLFTKNETEFVSQQQFTGRKRRLSKKQKRKRSKHFRIFYANELSNLGNLFGVTGDIDNVFSEVKETGVDVEVWRRVPSLAELCMISLRRKSRYNFQTISSKTVLKEKFPYGIKKFVSNWNRGYKELQQQLSFLQNHIFPLLQDNDGKLPNNILYFLDTTDYYHVIDHAGVYTAKLEFPKRSVWSGIPYPPESLERIDIHYPNEKPATFLFSPSLHKLVDFFDLDYHYYQGYYGCYNVSMPSIMSAFATAVDLMLPNMMMDFAANGSTDSERICKQRTAMIYRVKKALCMRYNELVDQLFDLVMPYVMWARGHVDIGTQMFKELVDKDTDKRNKAMYLSEIARMCSMFGDSKTAVKFFKLASDIAVEDIINDKAINEVTEQQQVLLASIYDTGVLTKDKIEQSNIFWGVARHLADVKLCTAIASIDAFLCYHAAHWQGSKWIDEVISKIDICVNSHAFLYYYKSMVEALRTGVDDKSTSAYIQFRQNNVSDLGAAIIAMLGKGTKNPWQPLIDIMTKQKTPVQPLKVIWRAQLQPPRLSNDRPMEAHINSINLNLCLNENGNLTGDMQMLLPPIRNVSFDLYTGALVLNDIPSFTGQWHSSYFDDVYFHTGGLFIPTLVQIYAVDQTSVYMLNPCNEAVYKRSLPWHNPDKPTCPMMFYWNGPNGDFAKINLTLELNTLYKKEMLVRAQNNKEKYISQGWTEADYRDLITIIDMAFNQNMCVSDEELESTINEKREDRINNKKTKTGIRQKQKTTLKSYLTRYEVLYNSLKMEEEVFVFGKTILVRLQRNKEDLNIFLRTQDKQSFLDYKLTQSSHGSNTWVEQEGNNKNDEEFIKMAQEQHMLVYNSLGTLVQKIDMKDADIFLTCVIIGPNIFGVNEDGNSIWRMAIELKEEVLDIDDHIVWSLSAYLDQLMCEPTATTPTICHLTAVGSSLCTAGKLLLVNMQYGIGFMNQATMDFVKVIINEKCPRHFKHSNDDKVLIGNFENCKVLEETMYTSEDKSMCRLALTTQNKLLVIEISQRPNVDDVPVLEIITSLVLPGIVMEVCFIGQKAGLLVSITQHTDDEAHYREHLLHFTLDGHLHAVLLCLSKGPRSFCPVFLPGNNDIDHEWHVYMRDGRDGILCVKLQCGQSAVHCVRILEHQTCKVYIICDIIQYDKYVGMALTFLTNS